MSGVPKKKSEKSVIFFPKFCFDPTKNFTQIFLKPFLALMFLQQIFLAFFFFFFWPEGPYQLGARAELIK